MRVSRETGRSRRLFVSRETSHLASVNRKRWHPAYPAADIELRPQDATATDPCAVVSLATVISPPARKCTFASRPPANGISVSVQVWLQSAPQQM